MVLREDSRWKQLGAIVGDEHWTCDTAPLNGRWPGAPPKAIARPGSREQVGELLRFAHAERLTVSAGGSLTKQHLGGIPQPIDLLLSLERLHRITDYQPDDLTLSVEAGVRMADLTATLRKKGQMLPLHPPFGAQATVGGVIATNGSGPDRLAYGSARDMVLGIHFATADGTLAKSGGKVVKNVAGYDVAKLLIGSLGSLGVVTDVTFKTFPVPPARATLLAGFPDLGQVLRAARDILDSPFPAETLDLLDRESWNLLPTRPDLASAFVLAVRAAGPEPVVERMEREFPALLRAAGSLEIMRLAGREESDLWTGIQEFTPLFLGAQENGVVVKSSVVVTRIEDVVAAARRIASESKLASATLARAGTGIVYSCLWSKRMLPMPPWPVPVSLWFGKPNSLAVERSSSGAPMNLKEKIAIWGSLRDDFALMQLLKSQFDPHGILNPGRFYGGI